MKTEIGWVYVLTNEAMPELVKIGHTFDDPWERSNQLSRPTGIPMPFEVLYAHKTRFPRETEAWVHNYFRHERVSEREFFRLLRPTILYTNPDTLFQVMRTETQQKAWLKEEFQAQVKLSTAWQKVVKARADFERLKKCCLYAVANT